MALDLSGPEFCLEMATLPGPYAFKANAGESIAIYSLTWRSRLWPQGPNLFLYNPVFVGGGPTNNTSINTDNDDK